MDLLHQIMLDQWRAGILSIQALPLSHTHTCTHKQRSDAHTAKVIAQGDLRGSSTAPTFNVCSISDAHIVEIQRSNLELLQV